MAHSYVPQDWFMRQHMVLLPEPLRVEARRHALLRGLHLTDAGYFPEAEGHSVDRPKGAFTVLMILCLKGGGWCRTDGVERRVQAGDLLWLDARKAHAYGAGETPWTIAWAHFEGEEVQGWREFLFGCARTQPPLLSVPTDHLDEIGLARCYHLLERGLAVRHQIAAAAALRESFCRLGEILVERHGLRTARERVHASVQMLRKEWLRPHRLEELATAAGMSVTHYCAHFRELTGFAPIDFLIRLRVQAACRLLDTTEQSVAEVAAVVGYPDPYYFTRCFRRVMGMPPLKYRKIQKG